MDGVFRALADPSRRRLLDSLNARNGQTLRELCSGLDMARQSVSKHLAVLEAANLVTTVRRGREKLHHLNPAPINDIAERWIDRYDRDRVRALADLKRALEDPVEKPAFVYTTYIRTTPERLWQALTEPEFTKRYWQTWFGADWQAGAEMTWAQPGVEVADPEQRVLEYDPPRRLAYTWHTFTPEWAAASGIDEEVRARIAAEPRSKVAFDLEPAGELVKLTVVHDGFGPDSLVAEMVSQGWPAVVAKLKTMLEADAGSYAGEVDIAAPRERVLAALTTLDGLEGWWTPEVTGSPAAGGELTFTFDDRRQDISMRVERADSGSVVWTCLGYPKFPEWAGTTLAFELRGEGDTTHLEFHHFGLTPTCDCYGLCSRGWDHYLASIKAYVETGTGNPWGSDEWAARRDERLAAR
jgi:uncharacterized protein YndB with AHSA1/START domain/DNA-binding transcriptional ArsR family regulator